MEVKAGLIRDDLDDLIAEEVAADPAFAEDLHEAEALLYLANETARRRIERGLSQRNLAREMNVSGALVGRFEQAGRTPSVTTLWKFASALNVRFVIEPNCGVRVECFDEVEERGHHDGEPAAARSESAALAVPTII